MNNEIQEIRYLVGEAWKGAYSPTTPYGNANVVQDPTGLSVYRSLKPGNVGHPLTDTAWWFLIIDLSSIKEESDRIKALNDAIAADEAQRVENENGRVTAEQGRVDAENARVTAEQGRVTAEQQRVSAEQQRASQEQTRISQEQSRVTAEQGRVAAEAQRVQKEQLRENNEAQRVINETNRVAAEAERVAQYAFDHQQAVADHDQYVDSLGAFDISAYHATGGVLAEYADLTAALGTNGANIPEGIRKGGMSVKFVLTSDNNYVQFRCMAQNFTTDVTQWQGETDEIKAGSKDLLESGKVWDIAQKVDAVNENSESVENMQKGSNYTLLPVKAKTGDKIKIKLNTTSNSTLTRFEIYYNGVWSNKLAAYNGAEIVAENINKWLEVTAPADITVIGWGVWNSSSVDETITLSFDNEESLENRVSKNTSDISEVQKEINSEKEASQNLTSTSSGSNYVLLPIDVKAGEQIQVKFNTSRNDVLTRFNINYNDDWSKKIIDVSGVDAVTENINKWIDFTAPIDMTYLGYAIWNSSGIDETVTISFRNKDSISSEIEALKENDQILNTEIENINSELGNAVQVSPDLVTGKFITDSGTIATNSGYAYTEPIELKKGDELTVNAAGYGTAVAMISLYSNGTYTPVVISYGSGSIVRDYSYIAENDCNVVCSFSIQSGLDHIISVRRFAKSPVSYDGIPYVSMFRTLLCIGDSTTAGVVDWRNPSSGADTVPEYSWPTVFNKITGVPVFNYGQASATCKSWYINHYPNGNMGIPEGIPGREPVEGTVKYDACVIQLGVNDWFKIVSDLGREPVNAEECASQIAEAKEYLGYLIEYTKVCSTSCKIFLATPSSAFNNRIASFFLSAWKTMLEELAVEYTDVFVVNINTYSKLENEVFFYNHPTALGYAKTAKDLASYISYVVAQNIAQFRNVQFIRTNHSY